jgi:hypothetical protein
MRKTGLGVLLASTLVAGTVSTAGAWTFGVDTWEYIGNPTLTGTVPGATYQLRVGVMEKESGDDDLVVDLHYGAWNGKYEYSLNDGANWTSIMNTLTEYTFTGLNTGDTVWLRVGLLNSAGNVYHFLSPSPWGQADVANGDVYYWAYPPGAQYYDQGTTNVNITGYVAVAQGYDLGEDVVWYNDLIWQQNTADIDGDGVIDDVRNSMGPDNLKWQDAIDYCDDLVFGGFDDWRLPTNDELKGLVVCTNGTATPLNDKGTGGLWFCGDGNPPYARPTIDQDVFTAKSQDYWTITESAAGDPYLAKKVNFYYGHSEEWNINIRRRVRCVRNYW